MATLVCKCKCEFCCGWESLNLTENSSKSPQLAQVQRDKWPTRFVIRGGENCVEEERCPRPSGPHPVTAALRHAGPLRLHREGIIAFTSLCIIPPLLRDSRAPRSICSNCLIHNSWTSADRLEGPSAFFCWQPPSVARFSDVPLLQPRTQNPEPGTVVIDPTGPVL